MFSEFRQVRMIGYVRWYNQKKCFGFIDSDLERNIFFHKDQVKTEKTLGKGDKVLFSVMFNNKGTLAYDVTEARGVYV